MFAEILGGGVGGKRRETNKRNTSICKPINNMGMDFAYFARAMVNTIVLNLNGLPSLSPQLMMQQY